MVNILGSLSGGGGTILAYTPYPVTSSNFSNAVDCPISALNGINFELYFNEINRFLILGTDYQYLVGGGFTILIPGFNKANDNYHFYAWPKT
jgi:hypothetical protein